MNLAEREHAVWAPERREVDRFYLGVSALTGLVGLAVGARSDPVAWAGFAVALSAAPLIALTPASPSRWARWLAVTAPMAWSALILDWSRGHVEAHLFAFGFLALAGLYRDAALLWSAAGVGLIALLLQSALGTASAGLSARLALVHALWLALEAVVVHWVIDRSRRRLQQLVQRDDELDAWKTSFEGRVASRTEALAQQTQRFQSLVEGIIGVPWELAEGAREFSYMGPQADFFYRGAARDLRSVDFFLSRVVERDRVRVSAELERVFVERKSGHIDYRLRRPDGSEIEVRNIYRFDARARVVRGVVLDVTEMKRLEGELAAAQKLESVGRLASGVAHEINTPVQFVSDSVHFLNEATIDLFRLIEGLTRVRDAVEAGEDPRPLAEKTREFEQQIDFDYFIDAVPRAIDRSLDGLSRVATIVRSMKEFAHPDSQEKVLVDLNRAVESTLVIARNEFKYVADLELDLGPLPPVNCYVGEINQVVLNLVVNAAHAISDVKDRTGQKGTIEVRTHAVNGAVELSVTDTGGGIPEAIQSKIFDPFFTTKPVGKGTGQGLALARSVAAKHQGTLSFTTRQGKGTCFTLRIPLETPPAAARLEAA